MKKFWIFIVLALVGGFLGLQDFYMKRWVLGVLVVFFCWTCIPALVAYIEAIVCLFNGEEAFEQEQAA
jgi:TM2 domain-containing membrane protein YozV